MALRPVKLTKILIISTNDNKEKVIEAIHDFGMVQIENVDPKLIESLGQGKFPEDYKRINELLLNFKSLEKALIPINNGKKYKFKDFDDLIEKINSLQIFEKVFKIKDELDNIKTRRRYLENEIDSLKILKKFNIDAKDLISQTISFFIFKIDESNVDNVIKEFSKFDDISFKYSEDEIYDFIVIFPKSKELDVVEIINKNKGIILTLNELDGKTENLLKKHEDELKNLIEIEKNLKKELEDISREYYNYVAAISEELEILAKKREIMQKFADSGNVFAVSGWIPERDKNKLENIITKVTNSRYILIDEGVTEDPPTLLENPKTFKFFEFFIKFYSLPHSLELDPTMIFAIVFPIFFGLMVGDVGYAIVILMFSIWLYKRVTKPPKKSMMPKFLRNFGRSMMSNWSWSMLARAMIFGSIWGIIFGIIFNEYFGKQLPYNPILDPINQASKLLLLTAWIGVIYVNYGLILGAINHYTYYKIYKDNEEGKKHLKEMFGRIGWIILSWGFTFFGLWLLRWSIFYSFTFEITGILFIILGAIVILYGEGGYAVMEMASIISHILSFTRIMGVLLAGVILSFVLDEIFIKAWNHGVLLHIMFAFIVLIIGHSVNILIAIFEPGIQGARLHYVEFFSKFFRGNGKPFQPFTSIRKYTEK